MNLDEIIPTATAILRTRPELAGAFPILDQTDDGYNALYEAALVNPGVCLVLVPQEGLPGADGGDSAKVDLVNSLLVCVVVNKASNVTGLTAWKYTRLVLRTLHFATFKTEAPGRHQFRYGSPAWALGPLDTGLNTYFCHFRIKSLDTILAA